MNLTKKLSSRISTVFHRSSKAQPKGKHTDTSEPNALSKIQTLPAEIKLQILEDAANICVVKNLVIACPSFHPVYCENRYRVLLGAHRKGHDNRLGVVAEVILYINKLDEAPQARRNQAWMFWMEIQVRFHRRDRVGFIDSQPSLSDLREVSRVHCWVLEKCDVLSRRVTKRKDAMNGGVGSNLLCHWCSYLYDIEIFAALIAEKDRGWAAASLPKSAWEKEVVEDLWYEHDFRMMASIVKVIWPSRFGKTPPCRQRTRALILKNAH